MHAEFTADMAARAPPVAYAVVLRAVESGSIAMLQRLRLDGPATDSVEALDEFLAGFVNEGNSSAPLYSSARLPSRAPPTSCMHASTHPYSTHANAHRDALPFFIQTAQARV